MTPRRNPPSRSLDPDALKHNAAESNAASMRTTRVPPIHDSSPAALAPRSASEPDPAVVRLALQIIREPEIVSAFVDAPPIHVDAVAAAVNLALKLAPAEPDLCYHAARWFDASARPRCARALLDRVLRRRPLDCDALILRARLRMVDGLDAAAADDLKRALECGADFPDVRLLIGDLYARRGATRAARISYRRALKLNPDYLPARGRLSALLAERAAKS